MNQYEEHAQKAAKAGDVDALLSMIAGNPCGCMGPMEGEPLCPCRMQAEAARKYLKIEVVMP